MAGSTVPVVKGPPQQMTGASLNQGTRIKNSSGSAGAVWIGSDQTVAPNHGTLLNPLASCGWSGKQLWACLDTGVTGPVLLSVSNDVADIDDPVAVATATAIALLASGIPNVLLETTVEPGQSIPVGGITYDVHGYSTLQISVSNTNNNFAIAITFVNNGIFTTDYLTGFPTGGFSYQWEVPVRGSTVLISSTSVNPAFISIIGTNQPNTGKIRNVGISSIPRSLAAAGAIGAGVFAPLIANGGDNLTNTTVLNGLVYFIAFNDVASTMQVWISYIDSTGTQQNDAITPLTAVPFGFQFNHPPVPCRWGILPNAAIGAGHEATLELVGAST